MKDIDISVLLPSRWNYRGLVDCLENLRQRANSPERVEVVVRCDDDDVFTEHAAVKCGATCLRGPRFAGYESLHLMYSDCAAHARGKWLLLWNDDATILTDGWDDAIHNLPDDCWLAKFVERSWENVNYVAPPIFPIFRREYHDALGHVSLHPCNDMWIHETLSAAGIAPTFIHHIRVCQPEHGANKEVCVRAEQSYVHPIYRKAREQDALKLKVAYEHWMDRSR